MTDDSDRVERPVSVFHMLFVLVHVCECVCACVCVMSNTLRSYRNVHTDVSVCESDYLGQCSGGVFPISSDLFLYKGLFESVYLHTLEQFCPMFVSLYGH